MKCLTGNPSTIQSNKTFLKVAQSCCFSLLTLVKHFKAKITAVVINWLSNTNGTWQDTEIFSTVLKTNAADIGGDQANEVNNGKVATALSSCTMETKKKKKKSRKMKN